MKIVMLLFLASFVPVTFASGHIIKTPDQLEWKSGPDSLPSGAKVTILEGNPKKKGPFTMRLQFPANYKIMPHWHPVIEHVTVLEGEFGMGAGEKFDQSKATVLPQGGLAVMPVKFKHFAFTKDKPATVQLHGIGPWDIIYLNPADDPRKKK